ncbi:TPA: hypothetical protein DCQ44_00420 [Candidatus Taylorbacteria bacterium]|nr:hypothetical protein [Candidatus Taylorbacteria bacterium]
MEKPIIKRPLFVTILCSFYFVYWAISIVSLIAALLVRIGGQFPAWTDIFAQLNLIFLGDQVPMSWITWVIAAGIVAGIIGFWFMQKWAIIVFTAASIALFIVALPAVSSAPSKTLYAVLILYTIASIFALNIAVIVVGIINFKRMK